MYVTAILKKKFFLLNHPAYRRDKLHAVSVKVIILHLAETLDSEGFRDSYAVHCRRRYVVRFVGVLYEYGEKFPPRIGNRVALELGVKYISYHLKRSTEYELTNLQRLKFYNKALKMEMIMLQEDLEWNDDLNDDMFNEIQRFERNVEREREENERSVMNSQLRHDPIHTSKLSLKKI